MADQNCYNYYEHDSTFREDRKYDIVVLGLGGLGSGALYWCSKTGKKVLGIEQFELGHHRGSSQDHSRITRLAYAEVSHSKLIPYTFMAWSAVEEDSGVQLYYKTGGLVFGNKNIDYLNAYAFAMKHQGIPFQDLSPEEAMERYPGLNLTSEDRIISFPDAGLIDPRKCNAVHTTLARGNGAHILAGTKVTNIIVEADQQIRIHTDKYGSFQTKSLILTCGPWLNDTLKHFHLKLSMKIFKEQVTYYNTPYIKKFGLTKFPIWLALSFSETPTELKQGDKYVNELYGFPVYGEVATKAGVHCGGKVLSHASEGRSFETDDAARNKLEEFCLKYMPEYVGVSKSDAKKEKNPKLSRLYTKTCLYECVEDHGIIVSQLPGFPQISVGVGAGHGYKWASWIGLVLSQLATDGKSPYDISELNINRPTAKLTLISPSSSL